MSHATFDERLTRITTRHHRMAQGVSYRIGPDGLMTPVPRGRVARRFPFRAIATLVVMAYAFKILLFVGLGEGVYTSRLDLLRDSGAAGEIAVRVMEPDALMRSAAELLAGADAVWLQLG